MRSAYAINMIKMWVFESNDSSNQRVTSIYYVIEFKVPGKGVGKCKAKKLGKL